MTNKIFTLFVTLLFFVIYNSAVTAEEPTEPKIGEPQMDKTQLTEPKTKLADEPKIDYSAKSVCLMEADSGTVLFEENSAEQLPIASVTKIMTMLLSMEAIENGQISVNDVITVSDRAMSFGGSTMFLKSGEQISVNDLLKGIAVMSANDGCVAIAEHIAGSEDEFISQMNKRAAELGMKNTLFKNSNGLDENGHYSSAMDVAIMSRELLKHPKIFDYTTIWIDYIRDGQTQLANTNRLIRFYPGANGMKTGSTSVAGCCISATAKKDGMQLISVILGAPTSNDRFSSATHLLDYGFATYSIAKIMPQEINEVNVTKGKSATVSIGVRDEFSVLVRKAKQKSIVQQSSVTDNLAAPVKMGDVVGEIVFKLDGQALGAVPIIATSDIERINFGDGMRILFEDWFL